MSTGVSVEKIVDVLEEVQDWEGLAGGLDIETSSIKTNCGTSTDRARCYRRWLVRTYCDRMSSGDPRQVATEISFVLDVKMKKKKQAQKLRELSFASKFYGRTERAYEHVPYMRAVQFSERLIP